MDTRDLFEVIEMFYIWTVVMPAQICKWITTTTDDDDDNNNNNGILE